MFRKFYDSKKFAKIYATQWFQKRYAEEIVFAQFQVGKPFKEAFFYRRSRATHPAFPKDIHEALYYTWWSRIL